MWVMIEDWSTDLGCYGTKGISTPNIDRLASEGMLYTNAYTTSSVSSASRSAMMTGYYQNYIHAENHRAATIEEKAELPEGIVPMPWLMREAGYHTHLMSWKTDCNFLPNTKEEFFEDVTDWRTRQEGVPFFRANCQEDEPFFARITFKGTHRPWLRDSIRPIAPEDVEIPPYYLDNEFIRRDWANGYEQMQICDREVGELLDRLKEEGLYDNTIVIFMADNGRCHFRGKQFLYEPGCKVPMIIRWPGHIEPGSVCDDLVLSLDICKTLVDMAGAEPQVPYHGVNLFDGSTAKREYLFTSRDRMDLTHDKMRAVRDTAGMKLIHNLMPERAYLQFKAYKEMAYPALAEMQYHYMNDELNEVQSRFFAATKPEYELYDLNADPYEINNLCDDEAYAEDFERLKAELEMWQKEVLCEGEISEDFLAEDIYPVTNPETNVAVFVDKNKDKYDYLKYGWPSWYPTRTKEQWKAVRDTWVDYVFRDPKLEMTRPVINPYIGTK